MSRVFHRVLSRELPRAVRADGVWIEDADGNRYLDGAGGAIVVSLGHGDRALVDAMTEQASRTPYVHGTAFTTDALEDYAEDVASVLPLVDARTYPVSGGSEAVETALKLARAYHLARGEASRTLVIGRRSSYHGNTLAALDAGGKEQLKAPYAPWLGRFGHVDAAYEYRCRNPGHPTGCGSWHADQLERAIVEAGPETVAAFIAEPVAGATLAAAVPTDDGLVLGHRRLPAARRPRDRRRGDDRVRPHGTVVRARPLGRSSGHPHCREGIHERLLAVRVRGVLRRGFRNRSAERFVHGFTWSHNGVGAAVAHAALRRIRESNLVQASALQGELLLKDLTGALADHPAVGDVRGIGSMIGIELVADRDTKVPFARTEQRTERVVAAARERGLLLYSSTGHVDGVDGDLLMLGPPFTISDEERALLAERTVAALATLEG